MNASSISLRTAIEKGFVKITAKPNSTGQGGVVTTMGGYETISFHGTSTITGNPGNVLMEYMPGNILMPYPSDYKDRGVCYCNDGSSLGGYEWESGEWMGFMTSDGPIAHFMYRATDDTIKDIQIGNNSGITKIGEQYKKYITPPAPFVEPHTDYISRGLFGLFGVGYPAGFGWDITDQQWAGCVQSTLTILVNGATCALSHAAAQNYCQTGINADADLFNDNSQQASSDYTDQTSDQGGYSGTGAHDHTSDVISIPPDPIYGMSSSGLLQIHKVGAGDLTYLGNVFFPTPPTIDPNVDMLTNLVNFVGGLINAQQYTKLVNFVVSAHVIPVTPTTSGSSEITVGGRGTGITAPLVLGDYVTFDCGTINVSEDFGNFIDYVGYRCRLFLPFVGFVTLKNEYFMGGSINVKYKFNIGDGSFMAFVSCTGGSKPGIGHISGSVIGQYGGNASIQIPFQGADYATYLTQKVAGVGGLATSAVTGNVAGLATNALTLLSSKPDMVQHNSYNASASMCGIRTPYLIIEKQVPSYSGSYNHDHGIPCNVTCPLSSISGYTEIDEIDLDGITGATKDEIEEIETLLKTGVYF